ncbi:MAG: MATE family efflux transporter [Alphaproteobacteria bacterium]|nr:MATE family efflux transporter [Alphaproteobacteria bacterium]MBU0796451.1 MATE family efflux transporter [Alphaproteobacteria bacterium]MBU0888663.1 MATE family efflux transporter [Alphaproteobacteria bacterium]MBU1813603.1 MATE family efflux transporter [Alphaproteobacteria bacterium]
MSVPDPSSIRNALLSPEWNRRVWMLAGPIILSNITVPLIGVVDTAVVGHLPEPHHIGAVAVGALVFSYLFWSFGFLRMGTTGLAAQAAGAGDLDEVRSTLARALLLAGALGLAAILLQRPILDLALWAIGASADVSAGAADYFLIRIWSAPAALAKFALIGWFLALQKAKVTLLIQLAMNLVNLVLDLLFVLGWGWGVEGVAAASVIAEYAGLVIGLLFARRLLADMGGRFQQARILDAARLRRMIVVNRDIFIRTLCLLGVFGYFTAKGASMGDITLAANAIMLQFQSLMAYALDGFAHAAQVLVGRAVGQRDRKVLRAAVGVSFLWALIFALVFTVAWWLGGPLLIRLLTGIEDVRLAAYALLPWAIAAPLISVWGYTYDGIFLGATRTVEARNAMILCLAFSVALGEVLIPIWGNTGLWSAFMAFMVARGISLALYYPRLARALERGES